MPAKRRPILAVSTKMYFSIEKTRTYVDALVQRFSKDQEGGLLDRIDVIVAPDFITLPSVIGQLKNIPRVWPAAQDCAWEDYGAFTGFVSPAVLSEIGARVVVVGHAEQRRLRGVTDEIVAKKAAAVVRHKMVPLVCIGEVAAPSVIPATDSEVDAATNFIVSQIEPVLAAVPDDAEVLLAYEPIWAIGAAKPASAAYVNKVVAGVRAASPSLKKRDPAITRILYGGSAGPGLFTQLADEVDGLFLGRFGHDPNVFLKTAEELADHA